MSVMAEDPTAEPLEDVEEREEDEEGGPVKSFLEHLEDLRWVLIKSVVALGLGMLVCLIAANYVVQILTWPLTQARVAYSGTNQVATVYMGTNRLGVFPLSPEQRQSFSLGTNRFVTVDIEPVTIGEHQVLSFRSRPSPRPDDTFQRMQIELMTLGPASGFFVAFQVAFYGGLVLSAPFIFYFLAAFIFPALKMKERYFVYRGLGFGVALFMLGLAFCYFIMMPLALGASQMFAQWLGFSAFQWKADEYISFVSKCMIGMGLGFEMPVVILTLVKLGVLSYRTLAGFRLYMVVVNLVLGAILTPPEVLTQLIMFIPLQLLYEVTIWIARYWEHRDRRKAAEAEAAA
jgi:sec-independent protein translocase protein TatC